jgi:hypothetical protein
MDGRVKPGHDDLSPPRTNKTTGNATRATNCIDKIRNVRYMLLLTESLLARRLPGPGEESPRLFENLPDHNLTREPRGGRGFPYLNRP